MKNVLVVLAVLCGCALIGGFSGSKFSTEDIAGIGIICAALAVVASG